MTVLAHERGMTVRTLTAALAELPPDDLVLVLSPDGLFHIVTSAWPGYCGEVTDLSGETTIIKPGEYLTLETAEAEYLVETELGEAAYELDCEL
jgi:hypothetical protein